MEVSSPFATPFRASLAGGNNRGRSPLPHAVLPSPMGRKTPVEPALSLGSIVQEFCFSDLRPLLAERKVGIGAESLSAITRIPFLCLVIKENLVLWQIEYTRS